MVIQSPSLGHTKAALSFDCSCKGKVDPASKCLRMVLKSCASVLCGVHFPSSYPRVGGGSVISLRSRHLRMHG